MRKVLHVIIPAAMLAAGLRFTAINCAYAADESIAAKSPAGTVLSLIHI